MCFVHSRIYHLRACFNQIVFLVKRQRFQGKIKMIGSECLYDAQQWVFLVTEILKWTDVFVCTFTELIRHWDNSCAINIRFQVLKWILPWNTVNNGWPVIILVIAAIKTQDFAKRHAYLPSNLEVLKSYHREKFFKLTAFDAFDLHTNTFGFGCLCDVEAQKGLAQTFSLDNWML